MCTHLFRRGSTYYFRRRIPRDIATYYGGKLEVSFSLRTTSRIEAVRLARLAGVRLDGEFCHHRNGGPTASPVVQIPVAVARPVTESVQQTASGSLLTDVIDKWEREKRPAPKTASRTRAIVAEFVKVTSAARANDVKRQTILDYKDQLLADGQSPANINVKLGMIGVVFNYAKDNDLGLEANPASRIRVAEKRRAKEKRREFDDAALKAIFTSPVYTNGSRPRGGGGDACYWLPLLALFTGARIEELAQLRPEDVYEEAYRDGAGQQHSAWVVRVTHSAEDGQELKTAASERRIPVHADLIRLGFLEHARAAAGKRRIFFSLIPDVYGVESGNFSKWFGRYLRTVCRVTDERMVFHSFRHTFKHLSRLAGIPADVHNALTGHTTGDVADNYGGLSYPLAPLVAAISKYTVPEATLPLLAG
ncbi:site-specific integrase [Robbsia sp. KACC 23696]|uniref:site-specific integrase n=1 Tax=Robbsia sp. KACC 23696 TaxID=3149231 RepID=UPI00325BEE02